MSNFNFSASEVVPQGYNPQRGRQQLGNDISETAGAILVGASNVPKDMFRLGAHGTNAGLYHAGLRNKKDYMDTYNTVEKWTNPKGGYIQHLKDTRPKTVFAAEVGSNMGVFNPKTINNIYGKVMPKKNIRYLNDIRSVKVPRSMTYPQAKGVSVGLGVGVPAAKEVYAEPELEKAYASGLGNDPLITMVSK